MSNFYKPVGAELNATDSASVASYVRNATTIRAVNTSASTGYLMTVVDSDNTVLGSMTLAPLETHLLPKERTHKVFAANAAVKFTKVSKPK